MFLQARKNAEAAFQVPVEVIDVNRVRNHTGRRIQRRKPRIPMARPESLVSVAKPVSTDNMRGKTQHLKHDSGGDSGDATSNNQDLLVAHCVISWAWQSVEDSASRRGGRMFDAMDLSDLRSDFHFSAGKCYPAATCGERQSLVVKSFVGALLFFGLRLMTFRFRKDALLAVLSLACGISLTSSGFADEKKEEGPSLTIGSPAPALDVEHWVSDGHGKFKPVTKFEKGKVYVVEFWATWCGPCIASMPHLAETQEKYADKGVQIVSISDEDLETVEGFLKRPLPGQEEEDGEESEKDAKDEKEEKDGDKEDAEEKTYGTLTSVYCLTTDPDRSVATDYMEAAGQNGIPTCFIVGKTGQVEWIGHPMQMDEPLEKVVSDKWDREAYLAEFKKQQERDLLMGKISRLMRQNKTDDAMSLIADAKKQYEKDEETLQFLGQIELQILVTPAIQKIQQGEPEEGLKALDEIAKKVPAESRGRIVGLQFRILMSLDKKDDAAKMLEALVADKTTTPDALNELSWQIYEAASEDESFSKPLVAAATAAAEKAAAGAPESSMILDTLAHLHHLNGDLDKAIEVQERAVKNKNAPAAELNEQMAEYLKELKAEKKEK